MEEHLHPLAATHLLQHTLRSLCIHEGSYWVYAVFWRILPRNYPPPKWDLPGSIYDRSRGNRRNWIMVWEDGFCNFAASCGEESALQPELFFKMSHEIYNYGEGLIGKVAADHSHKWVFKEPQEQDVNFLSAWHNPADSHPRTWEAQFQSGIKTIAIIAVREGVLQLGAVNKVTEDLNYVLILRKKFSYLESIPGVFLPHPSTPAFPVYNGMPPLDSWPFHHQHPPAAVSPLDVYSQLRVTPSMSSLEALLSKLPSVAPPPGPSSGYYDTHMIVQSPPEKGVAVAKEEVVEGEYVGEGMVDLGGAYGGF